MGAGGKKRTMRALTPMQLETLEAFYWGEVRFTHVHKSFGEFIRFTDIEGHDLSGRVQSLFKRRLVRMVNKETYRAVVCTEAGRREIEKHG